MLIYELHANDTKHSHKIRIIRIGIYMENILLPNKLQFQKGSNKNEAKMELEPCFHGYGITIGNALRRVLLSSLPGAAITAVKFMRIEPK